MKNDYLFTIGLIILILPFVSSSNTKPSWAQLVNAAEPFYTNTIIMDPGSFYAEHQAERVVWHAVGDSNGDYPDGRINIFSPGIIKSIETVKNLDEAPSSCLIVTERNNYIGTQVKDECGPGFYASRIRINYLTQTEFDNTTCKPKDIDFSFCGFGCGSSSLYWPYDYPNCSIVPDENFFGFSYNPEVYAFAVESSNGGDIWVENNSLCVQNFIGKLASLRYKKCDRKTVGYKQLDANRDGSTDISDAITILQCLFIDNSKCPADM